MIRQAFISLFLLTVCFVSHAQQLGLNPSTVDWKIIKTPAADIIYPSEIKDAAFRVANVINYQREHATESVGDKKDHIRMVVQNRTVIPNGYVALAPFRSEIYTTPFENTQVLGTTDWIDVLAIHEYRHVQQFSNTRYGITNLAFYLYGQFGWSLTSFLSIPNWYFEGDAVITETILTEGGRGRAPSFTAQQRAIAYDARRYSYMKARNGSLKDIVPNQYPLGYKMLKYLRNEHGNNIMSKVIPTAAGYKAPFYPFSRALKRHTELSTSDLYDRSSADANNRWKSGLDTLSTIETLPLSDIEPKTVTNYSFPQLDENNNLLVLKSSYKEIDQIVRMVNDGHEKIVSPGFNLGNYFHYNNRQLVWTEISQNPRRTNQSYSNIWLHDLDKNETRKVTRQSRYFSPVLTKSELVYAIHFDERLTASIQSIDLKDGSTEIITSFDKGDFVTRLSIDEEDETIVYLVKRNSKIALWAYRFEYGTSTQLTPWTSHVMDSPRIKGSYVYFSAGFSGIDNIYRVSIAGDQVIEQITSVKVGAYQPSFSPNDNRLYFTEHGVAGRYLSSQSIDDNKRFKKIDIIVPDAMSWTSDINSLSEKKNMLDQVPDSSFTEHNYKGFFRGLTLHSWSYATGFPPTLGASINNYLDDFGILAVAGYNPNEKGLFYLASMSYAKWFPIISPSFQLAGRESDVFVDNRLLRQKYQEMRVGVDIATPLSWLYRNYRISLIPKTGFYHFKTNNREIGEINREDSDYSLVMNSVQLSFLRRTARQNVRTRYGLSTSLTYDYQLSDNMSDKLTVKTSMFLPGITANHALKLSAAYRKEDLSNDFQLADLFFYTRGFTTPVNDRFYSFSVDYGFPLGYPDWGFWGLTYFKRIRTNVFYDYGRAEITSSDRRTDLKSTGFELIFDNSWFNTIEGSFGIRTSLLLTDYPAASQQKNSLFFDLVIGAGL